jgi:hypothetical protein
MKKITVPGQPRQKSFLEPISMKKKLDMVACTCHPSDDRKQKENHSLGQPGIK